MAKETTKPIRHAKWHLWHGGDSLDDKIKPARWSNVRFPTKEYPTVHEEDNEVGVIHHSVFGVSLYERNKEFGVRVWHRNPKSGDWVILEDTTISYLINMAKLGGP